MKVGDYVRDRTYGIGKITKINKDMIYYETSLGEMIDYNSIRFSIKEPKQELIDLIEVGDYVNGEEIVSIGLLTNGPEKETKTIDYYIAPNTLYYFKNEDIKSIVTKEQFESMEYKIGE